jgi:hypothetical protein
MEDAMLRSLVGSFIVMAALAALPANAADVTVRPIVKAAPMAAPVVVEAPPDAAVAVGPLRPEPQVRFGCSRIWRCDNIVCEWRRGCFGIYGYMEGPYYSKPLAERQWENHGWPTPSHRRYRSE